MIHLPADEVDLNELEDPDDYLDDDLDEEANDDPDEEANDDPDEEANDDPDEDPSERDLSLVAPAVDVESEGRSDVAEDSKSRLMESQLEAAVQDEDGFGFYESCLVG
jgi:hypothetical protein